MLRPSCDADLADEQYQRQHSIPYAEAELAEAVDRQFDRVWFDDDKLVDVINDAFAGIITPTYLEILAKQNRRPTPQQVREDSRARRMLEAVRRADGLELMNIVRGIVRDDAQREVELGYVS